MIRAILFDAAGTLIYLPRGVGWHYREIAGRHGMAMDESQIGAAFVRAIRAAGQRVSTGVSRPDDDKGWWRNVVRRVVSECGHEPGEGAFYAMFEDLYALFAEPGVWELYPEAMEVLENLHSQYRLGVISNFDRRLYPVLEHLGIRHFFETVTISSEVGADKPDARIFAAALQSMGATPAETLLVGDDPEHDWRGGEAAGLHVYKVERPAHTLDGVAEFIRGLL